MLEQTTEIAAIFIALGFMAYLTAFCTWKGVALADFLMDYNQYFWKVRYWIASRAAKEVNLSYYLAKRLKEAQTAGDEKANVMAQAYNHLADAYYPFKLWVCIYCMTFRFAFFVLLGCCYVLLALGLGWYTGVFAAAYLALLSWMMEL